MKKKSKSKVKSKEKKYSLSKRIVGLTIFLDSIFLVIIVVIGLFVFLINFTNLKEEVALTETHSVITSLSDMLVEIENKALVLSESEDVIEYIEYINDGNSPIVNEGDGIYQAYSRGFLLMDSMDLVDRLDTEYYQIFIGTKSLCQGDALGCIITNDGQVFNDSSDLDLSQIPWYDQLASQDSVLTSPYNDQTSEEDILTYALNINNSDGQAIGFVGISLLLSDVDLMIQDLVAKEGEQVLILSGSGQEKRMLYYSDQSIDDYLYSDLDQYASIDQDLGYGSNGLDMVIESQSNEIIRQTVFDRDYFITYKLIDDYQLEVYVLVQDQQALSFEIILIFVLAGILFFIFIIAWITNRTINRSFKSINRIIHSIDEIKNGNYSVKVNVKENNEIKDIGDAINIMSNEIERQIQLVYDSFAYDQLTKLKNKSAVVNDINQNYLTGDRKIAVCLFQVDNLKDIIIIKGQMMGDSLIKSISKEILKLIGKDEMLFSNGGNELIYIIPDFDNLTIVRDKVNRIIYRFKAPIEVNHIKSEIKLYAGIATYPTDDHNLDDLIKKCDVSIYKDKKSERKQVIFYNNKISQEISYQAEVSEQLAQALEKKEIFLKYQPLIDNKSDIYGFEALARWSSPVLGSISPEVFISNAEENYLIIPIGTWILEEACKMQVALRKIYDKEFVISVNVSLIQILQSNYVKLVKKIIKETDINPNYLTLELTESIFINSTVALDGKIEELHAIGVKFSLDDFGTGYASLSYLRNIAFDNLKIDKSFIDGILDTKKENKIVGTIIQMVHNLDMKVIAEGVEYKNQYEYLKQISTDIFQGFLLSKPLDINEAVSFVNQFYKIAKNRRVDVLAMQKDER